MAGGLFQRGGIVAAQPKAQAVSAKTLPLRLAWTVYFGLSDGGVGRGG